MTVTVKGESETGGVGRVHEQGDRLGGGNGCAGSGVYNVRFQPARTACLKAQRGNSFRPNRVVHQVGVVLFERLGAPGIAGAIVEHGAHAGADADRLGVVGAYWRSAAGEVWNCYFAVPLEFAADTGVVGLAVKNDLVVGQGAGGLGAAGVIFQHRAKPLWLDGDIAVIIPHPQGNLDRSVGNACGAQVCFHGKRTLVEGGTDILPHPIQPARNDLDAGDLLVVLGGASHQDGRCIDLHAGCRQVE